MSRFLILITSILSFSFAAAASEQIQNLASLPRWSQLLQYRASTFGNSKSEIRSEDFFLSPTGATNLISELEATVKAMGKPVGSNANLHAQCRFPARYNWIKKMAPDLMKSWSKVDCPDYSIFSHHGEIESVSFVFATGYLSNPASYFGHPLIKFNLPTQKMPSSLLDVSVNFGALTPKDENPLVYAAKGLFGGYDATFTHRKFYYNNHAYGEIEMRDMWEYRLNLSPEEVEYFYSHVWELIGKKFSYYFLSQNCATASAHLLKDAIGIDSVPENLPYALPYTFFDRLVDAKRSNGEPLVASVKLIPSRQTRLTAHYNRLDENQKQVVQKVARGDEATETINTLPLEKRTSAMETLFDYYSFLSLLDENEGLRAEKATSIKRELVFERLKLPTSTGPDLTTYNLRPPGDGPRPFMMRLGSFRNSNFDYGTEYQFRFAYYDFLTLDFGRPKNTEVRVMDSSFVYFNKAMWLRKLDLISVITLNLSQTGLPGDGGWAWRLSAGFEKLNLGCRDCDLFKIEAGYGKGFNPSSGLTLFAMLDVRGQTPTLGTGQLATTPTAGALIDWLGTGFLNTELSLGHRAYLERSEANSDIIKIENRFGFSRNWDWRATYEKNVDELYRISLSMYL